MSEDGASFGLSLLLSKPPHLPGLSSSRRRTQRGTAAACPQQVVGPCGHFALKKPLLWAVWTWADSPPASPRRGWLRRSSVPCLDDTTPAQKGKRNCNERHPKQSGTRARRHLVSTGVLHQPLAPQRSHVLVLPVFPPFAPLQVQQEKPPCPWANSELAADSRAAPPAPPPRPSFSPAPRHGCERRPRSPFFAPKASGGRSPWREGRVGDALERAGPVGGSAASPTGGLPGWVRVPRAGTGAETTPPRRPLPDRAHQGWREPRRRRRGGRGGRRRGRP